MNIHFFVFLLCCTAFIQPSKANTLFQSFDRTAFYKVLKNGTTDEINTAINLVDASSLKEKNAYEGALLMKKAGLLKIPKEKLASFKEGRIKLETALQTDSANVEYHFLRLIIQEHAPNIVKYNKQVDEDANFIKQNFKSLSPQLQDVIRDYSNTSKVLKPGDF